MKRGIPFDDSKRQRTERERERRQPAKVANGHDPEPLVPFFDLAHAGVARWRDVPLPTLDFTVAELIPHNTAWLIGGDSGSGKSILMQTLCTCVAADVAFVGKAVRHGRAIYITGEDRDEILQARQLRIFDALGIGWDDVGDNLLVRSLADKEMWLFDERGATPHGLGLVDEITKLGGKTSVAVIDSASLTFDAEEIRRRPVADFMRYLNRTAVTIGGSIGLVAHTSRSSRGDARSMVSGSTAWVAQARAGLLLEGHGEGGAKLSLIAPNYSRRIEPLELQWNDDGVLLPKAERSQVDVIQERNDDKLVLAEITSSWARGNPLKETGKRAVGKVLAQLGRLTRERAAAAADRLEIAGVIGKGRLPKGGPTGYRPLPQDVVLEGYTKLEIVPEQN